jgi:hypothetical protein
MRFGFERCALGIILAACSPQADDDEGEVFSSIYAEIFVPHGCVKCHDADAPGGLDMTDPAHAYEGLVSKPAQGTKCAPSGALRVAPGDSDGSLLVHKLEGHDASERPVCGKPMPQMEPVAAGDIERVRSWIDRGANTEL